MTSVAFAKYFGVRPAAARVLTALYEADGWLPATELMKATGCAKASIKVYICWLRAAMDTEAIDTEWRMNGLKVRYLLTEIGRADCAEAIRFHEMEAA